MKKIKWHIINGKDVVRIIKSIMLGVTCFAVIGSVSGCIGGSRIRYVEEISKSSKQEAKGTMQAIIDALEAQNSESLKTLFSQYAIENTENLDEKIEELMDFYPGCSDGFEGSYNTQEINNYGVKIQVLNGIYTVSNNEETYRVGFTLQVRTDKEPDKVGLYLIEVMTPEARPEGFKWKGINHDPGIYVLE